MYNPYFKVLAYVILIFSSDVTNAFDYEKHDVYMQNFKIVCACLRLYPSH